MFWVTGKRLGRAPKTKGKGNAYETNIYWSGPRGYRKLSLYRGVRQVYSGGLWDGAGSQCV